ncbi:hypothetical protein M0802_012231 [Mischocyttarus mexicanus]|nr:hypothetical protein M0802_012231 [Mischocyttarus mexicanus]
MGITGLLSFLEKSSRKTNINEFAGQSVAIDSYCWLHKGIYPCAEKILLGEPTDGYIIYCMKFIQMLLKNNIKPILVFDGRHLPAKAETEAQRRKNRSIKRQQGAQLIQTGRNAEGRSLLIQSIDVTHKIALELIKACQSFNIDCIVAPYEADAQLAYLNISGIADVVITEDSDLILFGCKKVFFKMDQNGYGTLVEQDKLHLAMDMQLTDFNIDKFMYMCILSGCDYLASLRGIGLMKAKKFIKSINSNCDIYNALTNLGYCLKMKSLDVSKEYRDNFIKAFITFKHQLVFCPLQRKQVRLNPPTADVSEEQLHHAGDEIDPDKALQLAYGNCDPFTFEMLHDFDPDVKKKFSNPNRNLLSAIPKHISIWSPDYKPRQSIDNFFIKKETTNCENYLGIRKFDSMEKKSINMKKKEYNRAVNTTYYPELNGKDILNAYKSEESIETENQLNSTDENSSNVNEQKSPILTRSNPFIKKSSANQVSPSLLFKRRSKTKFGRLMQFQKTVVDENVVTESKFFTSKNKDMNISNASNNDDNINSENDELCINHTPKKMKMNIDEEKNDLNYSIEFNNPNNVHSEDANQSNTSTLINKNESMTLERDITEETITTQDICFSNHGNESESLITSMNEVENTDLSINNDINKYNCNIPQSCSPSSESDYSVSQNSIEDNTNSLFKFSNIKLNTSIDNHSNNTVKRSLTNSQTVCILLTYLYMQKVCLHTHNIFVIFNIKYFSENQQKK